MQRRTVKKSVVEKNYNVDENIYQSRCGTFWSTKSKLKHIDNIRLFLCSFTGQRSLGGPRVCNLCRLPNVDTRSSAIYKYEKTSDQRYIPLNASLAVDQKYQNHSNGDCFGSKTGEPFDKAWWSISLPGQATIYKVNLLFREKSKFWGKKIQNVH